MPDFTFEHATDGGVHCEVGRGQQCGEGHLVCRTQPPLRMDMDLAAGHHPAMAYGTAKQAGIGRRDARNESSPTRLFRGVCAGSANPLPWPHLTWEAPVSTTTGAISDQSRAPAN